MDGWGCARDLWRYQDTGTTDKASKDLENLIGRGLFDFPKPTNLIKKMMMLVM